MINKRKYSFYFLFPFLLFLAGCSSKDQNDRSLPKELQDIPVGLIVKHNRQIVYATYNDEDPDNYGRYKWPCETSVSTQHEGLRIVEFGAYIWVEDQWVFRSIYGRPFNQDEFSKWYSCENALLKKGQVFTDFNNWVKGDRLDSQETKSLWYFIGVNKKGEKFKGTAEITIVGEFKL